MIVALSLLSAHALTCPPTGLDPVCDAASEMIDAANSAYPGSDPVFDGARGGLDEDRVLTRLRKNLDSLTNGGCLLEPSFDDWVAGAYGAASAGSDSHGELFTVDFTRDPKTFSAVGSSLFGDAFGTYNNQTQLVGDYSNGDFTYGFWVRVRGTRGVFFAFAGTCDGLETAGAALASTYRGDVSALDVAEVLFDGVCTDEIDDLDCDSVCDAVDSPRSPDCDGLCGLADDVGSVDCNSVCEIEETFGPDCDGRCDFMDALGSIDCPDTGIDGTCEGAGDPDCNGFCNMIDAPFSPDCNGVCEVGDDPGSFDCMEIGPDICEIDPFLCFAL